ncbi:hypothetical protein NDU88_002306 [Pleurodeles waltl]|uniref:Uncharacterized protein n=1 Tax=Pleurodeles waltl TaxID=8319 RepID=A0AAV7SEF3_PLEWA|nr:hypothetical protein NDU88_002306 [Pleurodeles waltl]
MPRGKTAGKTPGKPAHQLLFSEALRQQKHPSVEDPPPLPHSSMADDTQGVTMDHILQEISAVSRKLEGMDSARVALTAETRSMRLDIAGFQSQISGLDQRVATVETQVASWTDRDQELLHLHSKLIDVEDRSCRNNVRLLGFLEGIEGEDMFSYFLSLRTRLRHPDVKFSLFEPGRMWTTKNGKSLNFYNPEDLRAFLEGLHDQSQTMEMTAQTPLDIRDLPSGAGHPVTVSETEGRFTIDPQTRGRDLERLTKNYDDRDKVLQGMAMHTQISDRDKSRSPLKPMAAPT